MFGTTPLTLHLRPGNFYELTFTHDGYEPVSRRYRFEAHAPQKLRVTMKKLPEQHAPAPAGKPAPEAKPAPSQKGFFSR